MRRRHIVLKIGLCFVMLMVGWAAWDRSRLVYELDARSFTSESLKMVEERIQITLPNGSRGLNMLFDGSHVDPSLVAKIEIPAASHEAVAKQLEPFPGKGRCVTSLSKRVTWWNPSAATIRIQRGLMPGGDSVFVLLCEENGRWILYVEWACV